MPLFKTSAKKAPVKKAAPKTVKEKAPEQHTGKGLFQNASTETLHNFDDVIHGNVKTSEEAE